MTAVRGRRASDGETEAWVTKMRMPVVLLIGLFMIGNAAAQVVTAPRAVDSGEDLFAQKPQRASPPPVVAPSPAVAPPPATSAAESAPLANPLWKMPLASFTVTRERPIFSPSRRPPAVATAKAAPAPVAAPPKPAEPEKPQLALVGTIVGETGAGFGLFTNLAEKTALRMRIGEDHKGWMLHAVRQGQVVLVKGHQRVVLDLPTPGTTKAVAVIPPPAAPAVPIARTTEGTEKVIPVSQTSANPSPLNSAAPAIGGYAPASQPGAPVVATIVLQPPVLTAPAAPPNPFQRRGLP